MEKQQKKRKLSDDDEQGTKSKKTKRQPCAREDELERLCRERFQEFKDPLASYLKQAVFLLTTPNIRHVVTCDKGMVKKDVAIIVSRVIGNGTLSNSAKWWAAAGLSARANGNFHHLCEEEKHDQDDKKDGQKEQDDETDEKHIDMEGPDEKEETLRNMCRKFLLLESAELSATDRGAALLKTPEIRSYIVDNKLKSFCVSAVLHSLFSKDESSDTEDDNDRAEEEEFVFTHAYRRANLEINRSDMTLREETERLNHLRVMSAVKEAQRQVLEHQQNRQRIQKEHDALIEKCAYMKQMMTIEDAKIEEVQTRLYHASTQKRAIFQQLDHQIRDFDAQKQDALSRKREYMSV